MNISELSSWVRNIFSSRTIRIKNLMKTDGVKFHEHDLSTYPPKNTRIEACFIKVLTYPCPDNYQYKISKISHGKWENIPKGHYVIAWRFTDENQ